MIQKIKNYIVITALALMVVTPVMAPTAAYALDCTEGSVAGQISKGSSGATNSTGIGTTDCSATGVDDNSITAIAHKVVNVISIVVGAISVIMIIFGGFRYITSGGASDKVGGAKNTIIYALIGLIIVALAQVIVRFVLSNTTASV